jgi:Holliday junction resolvase-like predicted endonuclease
MKPFDPTLYKTDDPAKDKVLRWLEHRGYKAKVNPDQYGIDLLAERDGKTIGIEVEVKHNWKEQAFPYQTVHIASRKLKFFETEDNHLMMLNDDWSFGLSFSAEQIRAAEVIKKDTIYTQQELFIELPLLLARRFYLNEIS